MLWFCMDSYFDTWNILKQNLHKNKIYVQPKVREIWYVSIGMNIGSEIYGKGSLYIRPVLVINSDNPQSFIGIPLTSKIRKRKYTETIQTSDNRIHNVLLYQIRIFDKRRLVRKKYFLDKKQYKKIQSAFYLIYKIQ